ncbi:MAG: glutamyl-tRNA reductase [Acidimicrobiales bacterium]
MTVIAIGLNHRSAPLSVLEQVTFSAEAIPKVLAEVTSSEFVNEAVVLSTCNRTEVFVHAERFHEAYRDVRNSLAVLAGVDDDSFVEHLYVHFHEEAITHLFCVASGLDSAVLGEHEILGQCKIAWETAKAEGAAGSLLNPLFAHAIACGKRVRTDTAIGRRTVSISAAAVDLIAERRHDIDGSRVLLIGAGELGAGVANALNRSAELDIRVANRTRSRAETLAAELDATAVDFAAIDQELADADIVISATGSPGMVLTRDQIEADRDPERPLLMLDLAVPRDIDPAADELGFVDLLVLSDLQTFANRGLAERQRQAAVARVLVDEEIERYRNALSASEVSPLLGSLHLWAEAIRQDELDKYEARLGDLDDVQREAIDAVTKAMIKKLLHPPSSRLRDAAGSRRGERLAEATRDLFDLS